MNTNKDSKKYQVYGIGNALVDMEFEVLPEFLKKMNIEKGLMTLVDEDRQHRLIENLSGLQHKRCCGGSAANTIIAIAQMGGQAFYSCKVANDETGIFYLNDLKDAGVHTNYHDKRESGVTGKCLVFITPDADRTMNTFLGITSQFSLNEIAENELKSSEYLYIEGYLVASDTGRMAAIKAREVAQQNGVKVALTFSDASMVQYFKPQLMDMMGSKPVDLLFCNESEALSFTGEKNVEAAAQQLKKYAKAYAITLGPRGALVFNGEREIDILTHKVEAIDTNGAGDLFAGSFLYAITHGHTFSDAGRLACGAASLLVTQFGPRLQKEQALQVRKQYLPGKA